MTRPPPLPRHVPKKLHGTEPVGADADPRASIADFWSWAFSDLASNTLRGVYAEWLVARALGLDLHLREEWAAHDLTFEDRALEVKSSAYVQSWAQPKLSTPTFDIAPTRAWSSEHGYSHDVRRQADAYVFALLAEKEPTRLDPLDLAQWRFFVLATRTLDANVGAQASIGLSSLRKLGAAEVGFDGLRDALRASLKEG